MNGDQQQPAPGGENNQWQFRQEQSEAATPAATPTSAPTPTPAPVVAATDSAPVPDDDQPGLYTLPIVPEEPVSWTASEFIAYEKSVWWYLTLIAVAVVSVILVYLLVHDLIAVSVVAIVFLMFGIMAARKPRILPYELGRDGLLIGQRPYPYAQFKSFSVMHEGPFAKITFWPMGRFVPPLSVYYPPEVETPLMEMLARHLPVEHREHDAIDRFFHRIRF